VRGGFSQDHGRSRGDVTRIYERKSVAPHRGGKPSFAPNRIGGAQQVLHVEVRLEKGPAGRAFAGFLVDFVMLAHQRYGRPW
jgi:hypothetical protein